VSRRPHLSIPALLFGLVLAPLSGCGLRAVDVDVYDPQPHTTDICTDLVKDLPRTIGNAVERKVSPDTGVSAAWGDPAIVLRCGVEMPSEYRPDAVLTQIDGVDWLPVEGDGGYFFTTIGRTATVEVAVPHAYAPEAEVLTELAPSLQRNLPVATDAGS